MPTQRERVTSPENLIEGSAYVVEYYGHHYFGAFQEMRGQRRYDVPGKAGQKTLHCLIVTDAGKERWIPWAGSTWWPDD